MLLNAGDLKESYPYYTRYAYMKRCGPLVLVRTRGRLSHDESKQTAAPGTGANFGLFNVEWALITKMKFAAMNARVSYTEVRRAVPPNNAPPDVNQATIADSQQWFGRLPGESATTHP